MGVACGDNMRGEELVGALPTRHTFPSQGLLLPIAVLVLHRVLLLLFLTQLLLLSVAVVFNCQARKHHLAPPPPPPQQHEHWPPQDVHVFRSVDGDGAAARRLPAWEPGEEPRAVRSEESGDMTCVVCMGEMSEGDDQEVRELRCGHVFHRACVDEWVGGHGHGTCPLCRLNLGSWSTEEKGRRGGGRLLTGGASYSLHH